MTAESLTWGARTARTSQGWAHRVTFYGRRFWTASWSGLHDTLERDGPVAYRDNAWRSENGVFLTYPYAVVDDFGDLVPVPNGAELQAAAS